MMDIAQEDENKIPEDEDSNPDCSRSDSGDDPWMLIEVEKFQEALDESFAAQNSQQSEKYCAGGVEENEKGERKEEWKEDIDHGEYESLSSSSQQTPQSSCESSVESFSLDRVKSSEVRGVSNLNLKGCDVSINASEMFQEYFQQHHGEPDASPATHRQEEEEEEDEEDEEQEDREDVDRITSATVQALQLALRQAEEEVVSLRDETCSLMLKTQKQECLIRELLQVRDAASKQEDQLRQEREEKRKREELELKQEKQEKQEKLVREQMEQMRLLERSVCATTNMVPGPSAQMVVPLRGLCQRVRNLERETRQARLLDEQRQSGEGGQGGGGGGGAGQSLRMLEDEEEKGEEVLSSLLARLGEHLSGLENELIPLVSRLQASPPPCPSSVPGDTVGLARSDLQISLQRFEDGDLALFFPTPRGEYLAFNIGAPHHFLSAESKALIGQDAHFKKPYVLGRVVMKETLSVQGEATAAGDAHPAGLARGVQYHALSVASVADQLK